MRRQYILKKSNTLPVNKYCSGGGKVLFNIWFSRSVERSLAERDRIFTIPYACGWRCNDQPEGDSAYEYRLYLFTKITKDTRQPGSGEVLAACLDGQTGYVVVGFRA